jgi:hypothetical protein
MLTAHMPSHARARVRMIGAMVALEIAESAAQIRPTARGATMSLWARVSDDRRCSWQGPWLG